MKFRMRMLMMMFVICSTVAAQTGAVSFKLKGVLLDSLTNDGEAYATVSVASKKTPSEPVAKQVTDKKGGFVMNLKGAGDYVATLTSMGRQPIVREFKAPADGGTVDLGTMYVHDAANELKGVEVVVQKPLVKSDIDKIEYNIADDPDSKSNTMLEMLRKVPLVTVDGDDNIKVNGSSSFKVYVNGRPNNMMSNNPKEVLKSLPANSVKRIEVITNPGPKYDVEGVGGILNIITEGSGLVGYTATASANVNNRGQGGGLFGTVKSGKLTVSVNYNYSNTNRRPSNNSWSKRESIGEIDENSSDVESTGSQKSRSNFQYGSLEASYEIDTLRLVSMSFGMYGGGIKGRSTNTTNATSPLTGNPIYGYTSHNITNNSWSSINGGIDYQRLFHVKDRMLTFSYRINSNPDSFDGSFYYSDMSADDSWLDFLHRMNEQRNKGEENTLENTFQVDFTTPIDTIHTVEAGLKYIMRNNKSNDDRYQRQAGSDGEYVFSDDYSSHFRHNNDILAAYVGYGIKLKRFSGRLGLRYEHTIQDVKYLLGRGDDFRKDFDDLVPSASVGYKITDMSNLRLGYNMRIYRPGIYVLNPYIDDSNPTSISQGNPNLDSEKSHAFSLSYNNFTPNLSLSVSTRYAFTNNSIQNLSQYINDTEIPGLLNPTGKDVMYQTYKNIGKTRSLDFSAYVNWNITTNTRFYTNLNGGYSYLSDGNGLSNHGWMMFYYAGLQQTFPYDWRIGISTSGQTPYISLQGKDSSYFNYGLNVYKSFIDKRLTISLFANDFFTPKRKSTSTLESTNFTSNSWYEYTSMRYGVSVSFRIGKLTASVKKAARTITNDDVKGGGNNGQQ